MQISTSSFRDNIHQLSEAALGELMALFGEAIDSKSLAKVPESARDRTFTPEVTFWAFLWQCMTSGASCRQAVLKVQALLLLLKQSSISSSTSAYCQARGRLDSKLLHHLRVKTVTQLESKVQKRDLWMNRPVKVVDATTTSLSDTAANQKCRPQPTIQKVGCGFPVMKICALFSLATGALIASVQSPLTVYDGRLFARLWNWLLAGDVVLADRAFCSFSTIASLLKRQVDCVFRLHQRRPVDFRKGKRLGKNDRLIRWKKPIQRTSAMSKKFFHALPDELLLRELKFSISTGLTHLK